ncbi:MAG: glycogen/starch/alpha-glucan phosphorylase [Actinobacteria bacterium]|nr:glycogen/starch/alpha-glucan phosphorylase [Actinomycetota bacterium]
MRNLRTTQGVDLTRATENDLYQALGLTVRGLLMQDWMDRLAKQLVTGPKVVAYLSAEYLLGPQLLNTLLSYDLEELMRAALSELGLDLDALVAIEPEPGLGNGGLGRLAACYIDSLATLGIPAVGYGIRYEYGIFRQVFEDGKQVELPDKWLGGGNPWEFPHTHMSQTIGFGGHTESHVDALGQLRTTWVPEYTVNAVPYNYLVPGYRNGVVNTLRLWAAESPDEFNLSIFNRGDYVDAVEDQVKASNLSKVLYPEDSTPQGKELRLSQQYFFTAASIRDFLDQTLPAGFDLAKLPDRVVFQLNDTHPVIGIPELMRILVDEQGMLWDDAWEITTHTFNYTCHTLMPEALEVWSVDLIQRLLPRHMEIIYEINARFLADVATRYPGEYDLLSRMSIIQEEPWRGVRMAHLAVVGSNRVNGVAELHSQLLRDRVLHDFSMMSPEKFTNVTNGITPRRFLRVANPGLSKLITDTIGPGWESDLDRLEQLVPYADDASFREEFAAVKRANKARFASLLHERDGIEVDPATMYDVMVKRLHEYKRQILKLLHIVTLYQRIKADPTSNIVPRTFVFGAKAAPGYLMAKQTIEVILAVAKAIDSDPAVRGRLRIAFPANYNVVLNQVIVPAAELSEQISMAGKEASGTGNMKFALNGALTVGTLDGANVEIEQLVGQDNFFLFGLTVDEVTALQESGYQPRDYYYSDPELRRAIDALAGGVLLGSAREAGNAVVGHLLNNDPFLVFADYRSYIDIQDRVSATYQDQDLWNRMAILNVARTGYFSSDRAINDYLDRIWHASAG